LEFGADQVVLATGSTWRRDGVGRQNYQPIPGNDRANVLTPDDIFAGVSPTGTVVVFDDDHFYLGGVLAEKLRADGCEVILVTPAADVSHWTHNTMEQVRIQTRLMELDVEIIPHHNIAAITADSVDLTCIFTAKRQSRVCDHVLMVTMREPNDELYNQLTLAMSKAERTGVKSVTRIGDCLSPGTIAAAVYSGHRCARELDEPVQAGVPFRRELPQLAEN